MYPHDIAHAGLAVHPLHNKRPLTAHGFRDATTDPEQIRRWQKQHPGCDWGTPTAAFWVLDIDAPLAASVPALEAALGRPFAWLADQCGLIAGTPRGGLHLPWARTAGAVIANRAGDIGPGLDTRGHDADGRPSGSWILPNSRDRIIERGSLADLTGGRLSQAPVELLWLASLSTRDRAEIGANPALLAAMQAANPPEWPAMMDQHRAAHRPPPLRLDDRGADRMRRYAIAAVGAETAALAELTDGRRDGLFRAACRLARFAAHEVLTADEIVDALTAACTANGTTTKHGAAFVSGTIRRGLHMGCSDALPVLDAGRHRSHTIGRGA
jgi:hypothetical protein